MKWGLANGGSGLLHRAGESRKLADFSDFFRMDPTAPRIISTERGLGYVFALPVEPPRGGSPSDRQPRRRHAFHGHRDSLHS